MNRNPTISVVVPTKNRYKYLKQFITLVEGYKDPRIELLVQDNSDNNTEILDFLSNKELISTNYFYCSDNLSMGGNAELGIMNSSGEYVCFMGDDDAVCRNIADCANWMKQNNIEALNPLFVEYYWNEDLGLGNGLLYNNPIDYHIKIVNSYNRLRRVLSDAVPTFYELTRLYQALVKKETLLKVKQKGGTLFPGPTPDISSAVSLSFIVEKFVNINIPVTLPGMSRMGAGGVMGKVLTLDEVSFITEKDRKDWIEGFPRMWASEIIWPDGALNALKYMGREDYIKYFSKNKMLSRLVAVHKKYFAVAYHHADNKIIFLLVFAKYFLTEGTKFFWHKLLSKINGKINGIYDTKNDFNNIAEAESYLMGQIKDFSFDKLKL